MNGIYRSLWALYNVQCTLYTVHCTVYSVHCTMYSVYCTLYSIQCTLNKVSPESAGNRYNEDRVSIMKNTLQSIKDIYI